MDILSATLQSVSRKSGIDGGNSIDFVKSGWQYRASDDDEKRAKKKVWNKQQALLLASKVDRKTINDLLLKE